MRLKLIKTRGFHKRLTRNSVYTLSLYLGRMR